jgi:hypothetical protein
MGIRQCGIRRRNFGTRLELNEQICEIDVAHGKHLVDVVIAHPAGRVARAGLLLSEYGVSHAGGIQARDDRPGDAPVSVVERSRAADPVEAFELSHGVRAAAFDHRRGGRNFKRQTLCPVEARRLGLAPDV